MLGCDKWVYLTWIRWLWEETVAVINNAIVMVLQFIKFPITHIEWEPIVHQMRLMIRCWDIARIYHCMVIDLVLQPNLRSFPERKSSAHVKKPKQIC